MFDNLKKLLFLLPYTLRVSAAFLLFLSIANAGAQVLSIASVMPFLTVLANPSVVETNRYFSGVYELFNFANTDMFLLALGLCLFVALLVSIAVKGLHFFLTNRFSNDCEFALTHRLMTHYLRRDYSYFLGTNSSGLATNTFSEVSHLVEKALRPAICLLAESITAVLIVVLLILVNPTVAVNLSLGLGIAYGLVYLGIRKRLADLGTKRVEANRQRFYAASEAYGGIKDVKLLGREDIYTERFASPANRYSQLQTKVVLLETIPKYTLEALAFGGMMVIVLYFLGTAGQIHQALPLLGIYAFAGYRLMPILQSVFANVTSLRAATAVIDNVTHELSEYEPAHQDRAELALATERMRLERYIRFANITFSYPDCRDPVLKDFNIKIPAGTMTGFVGATGAGKSTVVDILLGLLLPSEGGLEIDGRPLTRKNLRSWQNSLGYVSQHIYLADDTITRNIAFGIPDERIDHARVRKCAEIAQAQEFVERDLPGSYNTLVGERGLRLSGGQRQRIGIARALYSDPQILILDEATSALDNLTEAAVMKGIHALEGDKTIIMVAHRLTTLRQCDAIYYLEEGRIVGAGTYDKLLASDRRFQNLVAAVD